VLSHRVLLGVTLLLHRPAQTELLGMSAKSPLMSALETFDATEANLEKLERLWEEILQLAPDGRKFDEFPDYEQRSREFVLVLNALPRIDGWKPEIHLFDADEIARMRFDADEANEADIYISTENRITEPGKDIREYRFRFDRKRKELVRGALEEHLDFVDSDLGQIRAEINNRSISDKMSGAQWDTLKEHVDQIEVLLGSSIARPAQWKDLRRHLKFGQVQDALDIDVRDWPRIRSAISGAMFDKNEPIPVDADDLANILEQKPRGLVTTKLEWARLDDENFERLVFQLIGGAAGYENPAWLMKTKAPDRGRDLSVTRVVTDALSGTMRQRVIIQCKHWLAKSISIDDISTVKEQMTLWGEPPVDVLVIATSGRFSADAVAWIETHNAGDHRLKIEMWAESHVERLLASRPVLIAQYGLR
jgi:Restriction endonuclease